MKKKNIIALLACVLCMAAAPMAYAEEANEAETETVVEKEAPVRPEYTASDYVKLGQYKGLQIEQMTVEASDEDVQAQIEYEIRLADALETVTEGNVQEGDIANIDYEGKLNGVAFDGGTSKGYDLTIGSGSFIDGFEDGLVGVAVGDTVDLNLTFPENYSSKDLAGQDVVFTVTVNEVKRVPELTDELVKKITEDKFSDVASYTEDVKNNIQAQLEENELAYVKADLLNMVADNSEILDYPQELVDYCLNNLNEYYQDYAASFAMEFDEFIQEFLGMTPEEYAAEAEISVKENVSQELYLKAILEAENMEFTESDYAAGAQQLADYYTEGSVEDLEAQYDKEMIEMSILRNKVLDFLYDNAEIIVEGETEVETEA